jgi:membrane protein DedA with SNARE-associated domain
LILVVGALLGLSANAGYLALVALVGFESAGIPVPGETALITAGVLAQRGKLSIELVIGLAAAAAIVGDNLGYLFGRKVGRHAFERAGRFEKQRRRALERADVFFDRHGAKAVFFGRWITGLRVWAAWLAGATHLPWRSFLLWNALGGIAWATTIGLAAYLLGSAAAKIAERFGTVAAVVVVVGGIVAYLVFRHRRHREA